MSEQERLEDAAMSEREYWLQEDSQPKGPFTRKQLLQLAKAGRADANTEVAQSPDGPWFPLADVLQKPRQQSSVQTAAASAPATTEDAPHIVVVKRSRMLVPITGVAAVSFIGLAVVVVILTSNSESDEQSVGSPSKDLAIVDNAVTDGREKAVSDQQGEDLQVPQVPDLSVEFYESLGDSLLGKSEFEGATQIQVDRDTANVFYNNDAEYILVARVLVEADYGVQVSTVMTVPILAGTPALTEAEVLGSDHPSFTDTSMLLRSSADDDFGSISQWDSLLHPADWREAVSTVSAYSRDSQAVIRAVHARYGKSDQLQFPEPLNLVATDNGISVYTGAFTVKLTPVDEKPQLTQKAHELFEKDTKIMRFGSIEEKVRRVRQHQALQRIVRAIKNKDLSSLGLADKPGFELIQEFEGTGLRFSGWLTSEELLARYYALEKAALRGETIDFDDSEKPTHVSHTLQAEVNGEGDVVELLIDGA